MSRPRYCMIYDYCLLPRFYLIFILHLGAKKFHHAAKKKSFSMKRQSQRTSSPLLLAEINVTNCLLSTQKSFLKVIGTSGETRKWRNFSNDAQKIQCYKNVACQAYDFPRCLQSHPINRFVRKRCNMDRYNTTKSQILNERKIVSLSSDSPRNYIL